MLWLMPADACRARIGIMVIHFDGAAGANGAGPEIDIGSLEDGVRGAVPPSGPDAGIWAWVARRGGDVDCWMGSANCANWRAGKFVDGFVGILPIVQDANSQPIDSKPFSDTFLRRMERTYSRPVTAPTGSGNCGNCTSRKRTRPPSRGSGNCANCPSSTRPQNLSPTAVRKNSPSPQPTKLVAGIAEIPSRRCGAPLTARWFVPVR